jgi:hypothetical protein
MMNRIIPHRNPFVTIFVCSPWYVPSRVMSRHHWIMVRIIISPPVKSSSWLYRWNHLINPDMVTRAPIALVRGQGLCSTRWNGWFLCPENVWAWRLTTLRASAACYRDSFTFCFTDRCGNTEACLQASQWPCNKVLVTRCVEYSSLSRVLNACSTLLLT